MYLARIADEVGLAQEQLILSFSNSDELLSFLRQRGAPWDVALAPNKVYAIAINNVIQHGPTALHDGDVVALLPPVTGG